MNPQNNTLGIPTTYTVALDPTTMIFLGVVAAAFLFHKAIIR